MLRLVSVLDCILKVRLCKINLSQYGQAEAWGVEGG